ncbi:MAG: leucine-rich repeat domain-containing protein [Oscillospiraceae bacterium]|nr:leucine-rich repeat domain-containing protein [Oscillospiraceae bacterium]
MHTIVKDGKLICSQIERDDISMRGVLRIPEGIHIIAQDALDDSLRDDIIEIQLPESLEKIETGVFSSCFHLQKVLGGKGLKKIGTNAFSNNENLTTFDLSTVEEVGSFAFSDCTSLENVGLINAKSLGTQAFFNVPIVSTSIDPSKITLFLAQQNAYLKKFIINDDTKFNPKKIADCKFGKIIFKGTNDKYLRALLQSNQIEVDNLIFQKIPNQKHLFDLNRVNRVSLGKLGAFEIPKANDDGNYKARFIGIKNRDKIIMVMSNYKEEYDEEFDESEWSYDNHSFLIDGKQLSSVEGLQNILGANDVQTFQDVDPYTLFKTLNFWNKFIPAEQDYPEPYILANMNTDKLAKEYLSSSKRYYDLIRYTEHIEQAPLTGEVKTGILKLAYHLGIFSTNGNAKKEATQFIKQLVAEKKDDDQKGSHFIHTTFGNMRLNTDFNPEAAKFLIDNTDNSKIAHVSTRFFDMFNQSKKHFKKDSSDLKYIIKRKTAELQTIESDANLETLRSELEALKSQQKELKFDIEYINNYTSSRDYITSHEYTDDLLMAVSKYKNIYSQDDFEVLEALYATAIDNDLYGEAHKYFVACRDESQKGYRYLWADPTDVRLYIAGAAVNCCFRPNDSAFAGLVEAATSPDVKTLLVLDTEGEVVSLGLTRYDKKSGTFLINNAEVASHAEQDKVCEAFMRGVNEQVEAQNLSIFDSLLHNANNDISAVAIPEGMSFVNKVHIGGGMNDLDQLNELDPTTTLIPTKTYRVGKFKEHFEEHMDQSLSIDLETYGGDASLIQYELYNKSNEQILEELKQSFIAKQKDSEQEILSLASKNAELSSLEIRDDQLADLENGYQELTGNKKAKE